MLHKPVTLTLLLAIDALQIILALPYLRRRVPPARGLASRSRAPRVHSDVWYEANARSARRVIVAGIALAAAAVVLALVPTVRSRAYLWGCLLLLLVDLVYATLSHGATTRQIERRHREDLRLRTPTRGMPPAP